MRIDGSVALVTGANRGLGLVYARQLVSRGAVKAYGAARNPAAVTEPGVTPIALDITDPGRVAQVAAQCTDVSLGRRAEGHPLARVAAVVTARAANLAPADTHPPGHARR